MKSIKFNLLLLAVLSVGLDNEVFCQPVVLKNVTLIDGSGRAAAKNVYVLINEGKIVSITNKDEKSQGRVVDMSGKTIMPLLINVHGHLGISKGIKTGPENFTREQIVKELERYQTYGVGTVVSMGMDKELIFAIRADSRAGKIGGASVYTAGYGFRSSAETGMEKVYRPATAEEAVANVRELATFIPDH